MRYFQTRSPITPPTQLALRFPLLLKLLPIVTVAALLAACPPPGGGGTPPAPTYTTTVSGKVTTPAGKTVTQYETRARPLVPSAADAKVWASTAPTTKVAVAADGSYTLEVAGHPGTFTLNVDYPAGRDYKAGAPQSVSTTAAAHTQNIVLNYGYRTTLSGEVFDTVPGGPRNEVPVIIKVEVIEMTSRGGVPTITKVEGREAARTVSSTIGGNAGSYRITFDHPGTFRATASFGGRSGEYSLGRTTGGPVTTGGIILR